MTDDVWPPKLGAAPISGAAPKSNATPTPEAIPKPDAATTSGAIPKSGASSGASGLTDEAVQQIRRQIILGESPPEPPRRSTQFQKGQSGNPKGRPRKSDQETTGVVTAQDKLFLQAARRCHRMMENGVEALMTGEEVVVKATMQAAAKGNPIAQKTFLDRAERAAIAEKKAIEEDNALWRRYVEVVNEEIEEAKAKGEPEPNPLPHPEDIVFETGKYVRFCGPVNEAGWQRRLEDLEFIDTLILQYVHDQRCAPRTLANGEPNYADGAIAFARFMNENLPKRLRLSDEDFYSREIKYNHMKKRELLKLAPKRWRAQGLHVRRGWNFPLFKDFMAKLCNRIREVMDYIRQLDEEERQASMNKSA